MRFTLTLAGPMAEMIEGLKRTRGITEQEAVRVILGGHLSSLQATPVASSSLQATEPPLEATPAPTPPGPRLVPSPATKKPAKKKIRKAAGELPDLSDPETLWRIEEVWRTHLVARAGFYQQATGSRPQDPNLTDEIRSAIWKAVLGHDSALLGPEDREAFVERSETRAAGVGLFYDPWHTGKAKENDVRADGKRYLEPWRAWVQQVGKADPVGRFAQLAFERRANRRAREANRHAAGG